MASIKFKKFDINNIFDDGLRDYKVIIAKSPKFIDEDFNPSGILYGVITRDIDEEVIFYTSYWCGVNDCYTNIKLKEDVAHIKEYFLVESFEIT